jgi:hypothetical protein
MRLDMLRSVPELDTRVGIQGGQIAGAFRIAGWIDTLDVYPIWIYQAIHYILWPTPIRNGKSAMKLKDWLDQEKISPAVFAKRIETGTVAVYRYLSGTRIPRPAVMAAITRETGGAVTAADFYASASGEAA